jgi:hypothetical protein
MDNFKYKIELKFENDVPYTNYKPIYINSLNQEIWFPLCGLKSTKLLIEGHVIGLSINGIIYEQNVNVSNLTQPFYRKGVLYKIKKNAIRTNK